MMKKNNTRDNKKRDANFELLRIISMIMIVCLHFNGKGQVLDNTVFLSKTWYISNVTEFASIIAVNLYVLITGYYMIKSKIKIRKILQLEMEMIFYSVGIYIILLILNKTQFNIKEMIKCFFPIMNNEYWFMTIYMGLYLIVPFLNKLANNLSSKEYKYFIIILTILLSGVKTINPNINAFSSLNGYTLIWFVYLYLLGGYIRNYYTRKHNKIALAIIYIFLIMIEMVVKIIFIKKEDLSIYIGHMLGYDNLVTLTKSVVVFLFFKNINIKSKILNKTILFISPLTLGVYLIHEHIFLRPILWNEICKPYLYLESGRKLVLMMTIQVSLIFISCCIIEYIRKKIFDVLGKSRLIKLINSRIENLECKK